MKDIEMFAGMQEKVQAVLDSAVEYDKELGCQAAVYYKGELIVNAYSGYTDSSRSKKVEEKTLFPIYSTGKGIAATVIHRLIEKGTLSYDSRIADLWPEYACNDKENTCLWHFLSHRSGMFNMPEYNTVEDLLNWDAMCAKMAVMPPSLKVGTLTKYHAKTFGWLIGETARRATGKEFGQLLQDEICDPLGLDSLFFGTTDKAEKRVSLLEYHSSDIPHFEKTPSCPISLMNQMNMRSFRQSCNPATGGMANALSIAKHYASLIDGVNGICLLKPETVKNATKLHRADYDPMPPQPGIWELFGLGYVLSGPKDNLGRIFGHGGVGGSEGLFDKEKHLAIGFTRNRFTGENVIKKFYEIIDFKHRNW